MCLRSEAATCTAAPTAAPDGRVRRWWEAKSDCLACVRARRRTGTTGMQDGALATSEPVQEGSARPVEGVRVCEVPRAGNQAHPVQGVRTDSVRSNESDRPGENRARASRVPVARPVGSRVPDTPVATVEAAWPVGSRGDGTMYERRRMYVEEPYYDYYHDPYYRQRYGYYREDPVVPLLGGLLLADLFLF
eukprot:CAMPEP_0119070948 /NCGR_PEP_ID=MMETSP1178-20130426/45886_1 /TAXON_ID=33656 /ORGANISM="unid sp, Strain CCMP2000" /LENGTH=190 /DNA_ID=CAMNT_0007052829 /DNA_START=10 /DNA_END=582 /DNA_ORIENTATION=-